MEAKITRRRRQRGTGSILLSPASPNLPYKAEWGPKPDRKRKGFATYESAEQWLNNLVGNDRGPALDKLRRVLWAELQARLAFKSAEIVSTRSRMLDKRQTFGHDAHIASRRRSEERWQKSRPA